MALTQTAYAFGTDSGTESTHPLESTNTPVSKATNDTSVWLLRILVQADATGLANVDLQLQYSLNGGTFTNVTTTSAVVKAAAAVAITNGGTSTSRIGGTGTFIGATACSEDGNCGGNSLDISNTGRTEGVFGLTLSTGIAAGDTVTFRVLAETAVLTGGYSVTPTLNITAPPAFAVTQAAYRFADDGTEAGATLIGSLNTALSRTVSTDSSLQLRIRLQETGGVEGAATDDWQLQYKLNAGSFTNVTASSSVVKTNTASALTDGGATTNRLGAGSGSFVAGQQEEADGVVSNHQLTASNFTEHVWALTILAADTADSDAITFQVLLNGATTGFTYTVTPTINVVVPMPAITSIDTDDDTVDTRTGVVIVGTDFGASETGSAKVEISNNATYGVGTVVEIDATAWSATSITVTLRQESDSAALATLFTLPLSPAYLWITDSSGSRNTSGYQFTLNPAGPTPFAALNTNADLDVDTTYLLRVRVENTGGIGGTSFRWSYNHASGGWLPVTTTSSAVKAVAASSFANDADVPEVLTGSGSYASNNDAATEDGTTTLPAGFAAGGAIEFVLAFQLVAADVADAETGQIRLELGDGTDLEAYTNTLTYTVVEEAPTFPGGITQFAVPAVQAAAATLRFSATSAQQARRFVQAAAATERFTASSAQAARRATQAVAASEEFTGTAAQNGHPAVQALAGSLEFSATAAEIAVRATQSLAAVEEFIGTSAMDAVPASQAVAAEIEVTAGAIAQSATRATQALAGSLEFLSAVTQDSAPAVEAVATIEEFVAALAMDTIAATQAAQASLGAFAGAVAQAATRSTQAISASLEFLATADQDAVPARQTVVTDDSRSGAVAQSAVRGVQALAGSLEFSATLAQDAQPSTQALATALRFAGAAAQNGQRAIQAAASGSAQGITGASVAAPASESLAGAIEFIAVASEIAAPAEQAVEVEWIGAVSITVAQLPAPASQSLAAQLELLASIASTAEPSEVSVNALLPGLLNMNEIRATVRVN